MRSFREAVEGEPMVSDYQTMLQSTYLPDCAKYLLGPLLGSRVRMLFEASRKSSQRSTVAMLPLQQFCVPCRYLSHRHSLCPL